MLWDSIEEGLLLSAFTSGDRKVWLMPFFCSRPSQATVAWPPWELQHLQSQRYTAATAAGILIVHQGRAEVFFLLQQEFETHEICMWNTVSSLQQTASLSIYCTGLLITPMCSNKQDSSTCFCAIAECRVQLALWEEKVTGHTVTPEASWLESDDRHRWPWWANCETCVCSPAAQDLMAVWGAFTVWGTDDSSLPAFS